MKELRGMRAVYKPGHLRPGVAPFRFIVIEVLGRGDVVRTWFVDEENSRYYVATSHESTSSLAPLINNEGELVYDLEGKP
jgi:hypothetical protein